MEVNWKVVSPDSREGQWESISNIYKTKIVVLASEPVGRRSRVTQVHLLDFLVEKGEDAMLMTFLFRVQYQEFTPSVSTTRSRKHMKQIFTSSSWQRIKKI